MMPQGLQITLEAYGRSSTFPQGRKAWASVTRQGLCAQACSGVEQGVEQAATSRIGRTTGSRTEIGTAFASFER